MPKRNPVDWCMYAEKRNLSRNHLLFTWHSELVDDFLEVFGQISNDKKVLDIGPGNGFFMVLLRELGFTHIEGLEISPVFLDVLRSKNLAAHLGNIAVGDGLERLSRPYDVVLMMELLEHREEPEPTLQNASKTITHGGILYVTIPIYQFIFERISRIKHRISREEQVRRIDETHIHAFSRQELVRLLTRTGFEVLELHRVSFMPPQFVRKNRSSKAFLLLRAMLPNKFRGLCLSVVAKTVGGESD